MIPANASIEQILVLAGGLLLAAVFASKASSRLGIPSLLVFLAIGMLAGQDGPGGIPFDDARLTQSLGCRGPGADSLLGRIGYPLGHCTRPALAWIEPRDGRRGGDESYIVPRGGTVLLVDDVLMVLVERSEQRRVSALIEPASGG